MSKVLVSETNLTAIADAIRTKNGSSDTYTPSAMATAIAAIEVGGGSSSSGGSGSANILAAICEGDYQLSGDVVDNSIHFMRQGTFACSPFNCEDLAYTVDDDGNITNPAVHTFPTSNITSMTFNALEQTAENCFFYSKYDGSIYLPVCELVGYNFGRNSNISLFNAPMAKLIGMNSFQSDNNLKEFKTGSACKTINSYVCNNACYIEKIVIGENVNYIGNYSFLGAGKYAESLVIKFKSTTPPQLGGNKAFYQIPTNATIIVPQGCLEAYTSATNYPSSSTYTYQEEEPK